MPLILNGTTGVSGVDGTAATPAAQGGDTNTGVFYGTDTVSISTGGTARVVVNSDGQTVLGAGTASLPAVTTTGDTNTGVFFPAADTIAFAEGGVESMRLDSSGNVSINGTSALNGNAKLSIWNSAGSNFGFATGYSTGTSQFRLIYLTSAANALNFDNGANNATLSSAGAWTNASDAKLKKNIQDIQYGLSTVLEAKPRSFNRVDVDGDYIGFVAQELETIIPEVVWANDKNLTVDYGSLVAVAFKAIQELSAKLDAAEARIAALEAK